MPIEYTSHRMQTKDIGKERNAAEIVKAMQLCI